MVDGFVRVGVATPKVKVADTAFNTQTAIEMIDEAVKHDISLLIFPELHITSYSCQDLFYQKKLQLEALDSLFCVAEATKGKEILVVIGVPLVVEGKLYNCAVAVEYGHILAVVPKTHLPNYGEFNERRWFSPPLQEVKYIPLGIELIPFTPKILLQSKHHSEFVVGIEICEDLWAPRAPSIDLARNGATVIANLSASNDLVGKREYRRMLVNSASGRYSSAYLYANAGPGESSTDIVFLGHSMISENGIMLCESNDYFEGLLYSEIDVEKLVAQRLKNTTFSPSCDSDYLKIEFSTQLKNVPLTRCISPHPFVPQEMNERANRCEEILTIQKMGLVKRLEHTKIKKVVIGLSGGLDSTLALLVSILAFDYLKLDRKGIIAITMPCFGTTKRTKQNAIELSGASKVTFKEIDITSSVKQHFIDIGHDGTSLDVVYENAQARERTQVLMDVANKEGALVIGTGDLSELALGWATYNGDHMSMYGVNASIPKTLVRVLVHHVASTTDNSNEKKVLLDILNTPVSPELLPSVNGEISQVTEHIVGPYELHDFFIYYAIRWNFTPTKVYHLAKVAFKGVYDDEVILTWLKTFYSRFFSQQFKRSCSPDGPKVGSASFSPRGDLRMPSDASSCAWLDEVNALIASIRK